MCKQAHSVVIGCGNSDLSERLFDDEYSEEITSVDFSQLVSCY